MSIRYSIIIKLFITIIISLILTPLVRIIAFRIGATDKPGPRRVNKKVMPTMGGLAIFIAFAFSSIFLFKDYIPHRYLFTILLGALIIVITGVLDDIFELKPKQKLFGILLASLEIYFVADIHFDSLTLPFFGFVDLGWLSFPMTLLWIVAITNAVNLIDGLDGLASGVSIIALSTIGLIGYFFLHSSQIYIPILIFILVAAIIGFFPYNFYPATIYLGDTGALLLGFMTAVLSLQGLKNATLITMITPMFILGVPITDTVYAILRRTINHKPISSADKMHLHHRLLSLGFSHRGAVMTIYALALVFSFIALIVSYNNSGWGTALLIIAVLIGLELFAELIGLMGPNHQPLLYLLRLVGNKDFREEEQRKHKNKK